MSGKDSPQDSENPGKKKKKRKEKKGKKEAAERQEEEQPSKAEERAEDSAGKDVLGYLKRGFEKTEAVARESVMPSLKKGWDYSKKRFKESKGFRYGVIGAGVFFGLLALGKCFGSSGSEISFVAENDIYIVRDDGSGKRNITNTPHVKKYGPSWSRDGSMAAFNQGSLPMNTIYIITKKGKNIRELKPCGWSNAYPVFSPNGRRMAFLNYPSHQVCSMNVDGSGLKNTGDSCKGGCKDGSVSWVDNYRVAFISLGGRALIGVRTKAMNPRVYIVNVDNLERKILFLEKDSLSESGVLSEIGMERAVRSYCLSADGKRIIMQVDNEIHVGSLDGKIELLEGLEIGEDFPALSPDGSEIAFAKNGCIYTTSFRGGRVRQLTGGPGDRKPLYSANGDSIAFFRGNDIWVMSRKGSRQRNVTNTPEVEEEYVSWVPE